MGTVRTKDKPLNTTVPNDVRAEFALLAALWKRSTWHISSPMARAADSAYRQIVAMGRPAIPLILEELRREPDEWFAALESLTGENPVATEDHGDIGAMTHAWLDWGREHGYR